MTIAPKKILLVHNDRQERARLAIMLSRFGHEVKFSCGKDCSDQLVRAYDVVIVDDRLSGQSGLDFIDNISSRQRKKIIYLSPIPSLAASMQNLNIYEWITKPADPLKLAVVVCDYFVEYAMEEPLPS
tara:strand:- start:465 stop:848 length:384 start_codon:yes stop_codon:yes gene_type:complete